MAGLQEDILTPKGVLSDFVGRKSWARSILPDFLNAECVSNNEVLRAGIS